MNTSAEFVLPRSRALEHRRQGGFSLIVSLLMLVVIIILGIGAANMALNEERGARNDRDRQIAFQAAEAALKDAEGELMDTTNAVTVACGAGDQFRGRTVDICFDGQSAIGFADGCSAVSTTAGLCETSTSAIPVWEGFNLASDTTKTVAYGQFTGKTYPTGGASQPSRLPRYIIERVPKNNTTGESVVTDKKMYRVTAIGFGPNENAQVVLQSIVNTLD